MRRRGLFGVKTCNQCNEEKCLDEFYFTEKNSLKRGCYFYYHTKCKQCCKDNALAIQIANPDKHREAVRKNNQTLKRKQAFRENSKRRRENGEHQKWLKNNPDKQRNYQINHLNKKHNISDEEWWECRRYFNFRCAYCSKTWEQNYQECKKDLAKEHFLNYGASDLSNCLPACISCNSQKWKFDVDKWYTPENPIFDSARLKIIHRWINRDHKNYMETLRGEIK